MREIRITVNADGTTTTDFTGFVGPTCLAEAETLRQLLAQRFGITLAQTNFIAKPELQAETQEQHRTSQQQGA